MRYVYALCLLALAVVPAKACDLNAVVFREVAPAGCFNTLQLRSFEVSAPHPSAFRRVEFERVRFREVAPRREVIRSRTVTIRR